MIHKDEGDQRDAGKQGGQRGVGEIIDWRLMIVDWPQGHFGHWKQQ